MKASCFFATALCLCLTPGATALTLVEDGKPAATIVMSPGPARPRDAAKDSEAWIAFLLAANAHDRVHSAAKDLQEHLRAITGAELPLVEDTARPEGALILIGDTAQGRALGFPGDALNKHYVLVRVSGNALVLQGRDHAAWDGRHPRGFSGTSDAVYVFLEQVLGVRWFAPGKVGRELPPATRDLSVPDDLDVSQTPSVVFGGEMGRMRWHSRNRAKVRGSIKQWGGHNWTDLLKTDIYLDKENHPESYHPEHFALVGGKRGPVDPWPGGSLCTSNPDVIRICADSVRRLFDAGFDVVELGAPDSYSDVKACHCPECMKVSDTSTAGLGNRVWVFHLAIARELLETHPRGKYVEHLMYGPTYHVPPEVTGPLPSNFMAKFTGSRGEVFRLMKKYRRLGFAASTLGLYEFTSYNPLGFGGPKSSVAQIAEVFRKARENDVIYIYWCGWADNNFGLETPQYWLAMQLQWNWNQNPHALMEEFWRRYFRAAGEEMKTFYGYLDRRKRETILARYPLPDGEAFKGHFAKLRAYQVYPLLFGEETHGEVSRRLARAKALAKGDDVLLRRIGLVEEAYEFNKITAACFPPHARFQRTGALEDAEALKAAVEKRRAFVADLRRRGQAGEFDDFCPPVLRPGWWQFGSLVEQLDSHGPFQGPFTLDLDVMIAGLKANPLKTHVIPRLAAPPDERSWARIEPLRLQNSMTGEMEADFATDVRVAWTPGHLYARFDCQETKAAALTILSGKKRDDPVWRDDDVEVFVGHPEDASKYYQFLANAVGVQADLSRGWPRFDLDPEPLKPNIEWDAEWTVEVDLSKAPRLWQVTMAIPLKDLQLAPKAGDTWRMNFGRYRPRKSDDEPKAGYAYSWNPTFGQFGNTGRFGMITFGE